MAAQYTTEVFLKLVIEAQKQGLEQLRGEMKQQRQEWQRGGREAQTLGQRLRGLAKSALSAVNPIKMLTNAWSGFLKRAGRLASYYIIYRGLRLIMNAIRGVTTMLFETAPAFQEVQRGFYLLASAAGTTGAALLKGMQDASKGTLAQMDLMKKASYATLVYGKGIAEHLPELVAGARRASKVLGVDLTYAFNSLVDGISRFQKRILDNIGIVFAAESAYKEYAAAHDTTVKAMGEAEKKAAYLAYTLKYLRAQEAALGEDTYTARDAIAAFRVSVKDFAVTSFQVFLPALKRIFMGLSRLGGRFGPDFRKAIALAAIALERFVDLMSKAVRGDWDSFWRSLGEGAKTGLAVVLVAVIDWGRAITAQFDKWTGGFFSWGAELVFQFAKGFISAASTVLVTALNFVGNVIKSFLGAFSPPKEGPLRDILKWGIGLIETYFAGFNLASFDLFEQAIGPIEKRLQSLLQWEDIDEAGFAEGLTRARELLAQFSLQLQETGTINEEVLGQLGELLQGTGGDVVRYIRVLSKLIQAQRVMEGVQEEYNKEAEKGFVSERMATKMREAKLALEGAEKEEKWERAFVSQRQAGIDVWLRFQEAAKKAADTIGGLFDDLNLGIADMGVSFSSTMDDIKASLEDFEFSDAVKNMKADIELFFAGLRGETPFAVLFGKDTGVPEAWQRGADIRAELDKMKEAGEGLAEALGELAQRTQEFFDSWSQEDIARLAKLALGIAALATVLGIGVGLAGGGAAGGVGLGLGALALGLITLMAALTDTSFTEQLALIEEYWAEKLPVAIEKAQEQWELISAFWGEEGEGGKLLTGQWELIREFWGENLPLAVEAAKKAWDEFWAGAEKGADEQEKTTQSLKDKWDEFWAGAEKGADEQERTIQSLKDKWAEFFGTSEENMAQYATDFQGVTNVWEGILAVIRAAINAVREFLGLEVSSGAVGMPGGTLPGPAAPPTLTPNPDLPVYLPLTPLQPYTPPPRIPRGFQEFQHGGFIPRTGLYGLHEDELVLNKGQWKGMLGALGSRALPANVAMGGGGGTDAPLIHMENVYVRNEQDVEKLAARISFIIGQNANRRARLGA